MLSVILILTIALLPAILAFLLQHRLELQAQERLQAAMAAAERQQFQSLLRLPPDYQYIEGVGALIGDFTCVYNARSPCIRCAVNPTGPCETCRLYESKY